MILQVYDGNIHPDEWLKQFNTYCFLKEITENNIKFAKMMIDSTINVPKDVTSLTEIISALKVDASFTIFKNTNKRKLQILKYKSEKVGGDTAKFIDTFRKLCRDSEIVDLDEQKQYFIETLPFVATGKYLSTNENLRYETGSKSQMVFLGDTEPHRISFWKIKFDKDYATIDTFMTSQQRFDKFLGLRHDFQVNIGKEVFKEVACHNKGIGVNDNCCIELIE
ncbi:hypothetical protein RhiirC2_856393 [Rhizophagus irregularis]|uniref:MIR domain-containing protein n=1 Tax=Rhizophagus irregularis TaxID=588596 RepID=A0A2N1MHU5_9GLOM|nr:hypothetical protein RhiirC2_856393 [Rhizophagus irregularis]